ncbi:discoidin domain-containing protein [Histomonas meleagridis]|uniref:discoidin domain-containing protein n=1 Tax=Histomonas meleagridis TaxID=135588 RepID=UPI00355A929D|nr:discoidin domain-containing protein [Histomonas meleagridis]KAH0799208.1 discoidin domain-containing protein [Histomonas meleagridis]
MDESFSSDENKTPSSVQCFLIKVIVAIVVAVIVIVGAIVLATTLTKSDPDFKDTEPIPSPTYQISNEPEPQPSSEPEPQPTSGPSPTSEPEPTPEFTFPHNISYYQNYMESMAQFIQTIQMEDGAILDHIILTYARTRIVPYFSCTAAEGLLVTGNQSYHENVRKFCEWYFNHLNKEGLTDRYVAGSIFDYYYQLISEVPEYEITTNEEMDSEDSYAALFLNLLYHYANLSYDYNFLIEHRSDIDLVSSVLTNPEILNDCLTYAKSTYHIKYNMDNSEVYSGFLAAEWIYRNVFNDDAKADEFHQHSNRLIQKFEEVMWSEVHQFYKYHADQADSEWNLSIFHPQGLAQIFPQIYGLIDPNGNRSQILMDWFVEQFPLWMTLEQSDDGFPHAVAGRALTIGHKWETVVEFLDNIKKKFVDTGFESGKFYSAEIGHAMHIIRNILDCETCTFSDN